MDCIGKNSIPFFVVIEKISTIFSGSFERKEWKEWISPKTKFSYQKYFLASWMGYTYLKHKNAWSKNL